MKILSIIIPVYNTPKEYFEKCLESLECKRKDSVEVIVVDDGSKEQSRSEIKTLVDNSSLDIHYYEKSNGGQNSAREYGLDLAEGEYIFFMDSDDYVDTVSMDTIICLLEKNKPEVLAYNHDVVTPDGRILKQCNKWDGSYGIMDIAEGIKYCDSLCLSMYNREALQKSGIKLIQGVRIGEDFATATAILSSIGNANTTNMTLYHYVKRSGSALSSPPTGSELDIMKAFNVMLSQVSTDTLERYYGEFEWLAILHVLYYGQLRILAHYDGSERYLRELWSWINNQFPNWRGNSCLKSEKIAQRLSFKLIIHGKVGLLGFLLRIKRKIKRI